MENRTVTAHLNSLKGQMQDVILLGPSYKDGKEEDNRYVFNVNNKLCLGLFNWFVCEYYVDDLYTVITENNENYRIYGIEQNSTKKTLLNTLKEYIGYEFSSGSYIGEDYKKFENIYIRYLKKIAKANGWVIAKELKNHYEFSVFFESDNKFVYMSIPDVRFFQNEWYNNILIRTAGNIQDYHGGPNNYTSLKTLEQKIHFLFDAISQLKRTI